MGDEVHFWRSMLYGCDSKEQHRFPMFLEDGCEGPRTRTVEALMKVPWGGEKQKCQLAFTEGGRIVIPVPFVIHCWCGRSASHIRWGDDPDEDITKTEAWLQESGRENFPHFRYDPSENPEACGIPVGPSQFIGEWHRA